MKQFRNLRLMVTGLAVCLGLAASGVNPVWAAVKPMVAAGWLHSLALKSNGTVVAWGDNRGG